MPGPGSYMIGQEEIDEVMDVMSSGYLFRYGQLDDPNFKQKVYTLEQEYAKYIGVKHAVATSSGTGSLLIGLLALGIEPGDEVIVPGYTFVASYTSIIFAGGSPVLAEVDESLTLDPDDIEKRITERTKFIMPVHMLGNVCDMDRIMQIAQKNDLKVIEDCCQAVGAVYKGRKAGSIGHIGGFSLNVFKTITAGDGGIVVVDDQDLYERAFGFHDQGHSPNRSGVDVGKRNILGLNFRMNEVTGAIALAQFRKLDNITAILREKKDKLKAAIGDVDGMRWRTLHSPEGECGTLLTAIFDDAGRAREVAGKLGTKTISNSGWHVYYNMEHVMEHLEKIGRPAGKGVLPRTDNLLARSINISIGVVDAGLGSAFGININSTDDEIQDAAEKFRGCAC
jgi:dTDP-4-amino-4,6-dideoxygalactose transaminase